MTVARPGASRPATAQVMASLLERLSGQQLADNRAWRLETSLKPLVRELGMSGIDELARAVSRDDTLADPVLDALLNQETSFFRDGNTLETVADAAQAARANGARRLRLWSAACSTGQEPLSLAILLEERGMGADVAELVATDVSKGAIDRARTGRFSQFEIQRGLSVRRMIEWFHGEGGDWTANPALLRRIQFRRHNLVAEPAPMGGFDIILCRNLLLYFAPDVRRRAFDRLADALRPNGLLMLGASETAIGQTDRFVPAEAAKGFYRLA